VGERTPAGSSRSPAPGRRSRTPAWSPRRWRWSPRARCPHLPSHGGRPASNRAVDAVAIVQ